MEGRPLILSTMREQAGLTQQQVAHKMGYKNQATIAKMEARDLSEQNLGNIWQYAEACGWTIDIVFHGPDFTITGKVGRV